MPNSRSKHCKIPGYITEIDGDRWFARLDIEGTGYFAEMRPDDLPPDAVEGMLFTIHRTKRGRQYIYWVRKGGLTRSKCKRARIKARKWHKLLFGNVPEAGTGS